MELTKKQIREKYGITPMRYRMIFTDDFIREIVGMEPNAFKRHRKIPAFAAQRICLWFEEGDTYVPEEGVYSDFSGLQWATDRIDSNLKVVDLKMINKFGQLTETLQQNIPFKVMKTAYKKLRHV